MKKEHVEALGALGGVAVIVGGLLWVGSLTNRVSQLEQDVRDLRMGPRGQNCQQIVGELVKRPTDKSLLGLAYKWGCNATPAIQLNSETETKSCPDGAVVGKGDDCPPPPPPPPSVPAR